VKTTRHDPYPCPYCGETLEANTSTGSPVSPNPGDIGVCVFCENVTIFVKGMKARKLAPYELGLLSDPQIVEVLNALRKVKQRRST
jgi:hypothetical protein